MIMKSFFNITLCIGVFLGIKSPLIAGPGDTTVIQTFTFGYPLNPGWLSPMEGYFEFPSDTISYEKILLSYTLKCNPAQSPNCGEWDYLTYVNLFEHTGCLDSNLLSHYNFELNGSTPDSIGLSLVPTHHFNPRFELFPMRTDTTSISTFVLGTSTTSFSMLPSGAQDGKQVFLIRASELSALGMMAGHISGIGVNLSAPFMNQMRLIIRIRHWIPDTILPMDYIDSAFLSVFDRTLTGMSASWNDLDFHTPFVWDGVSNVLIEFSWENPSLNALLLEATSINWNSGVQTTANDSFLEFDGADCIEIPPAALASLQNEITIAFWCYGDPSDNPQNNSIIEAVDAENHRLLNVHLPWSNGNVYWDAGDDGAGNYDRIDKSAGGSQNYMGRWNHWTFIKNATSGVMQIYLNGALFHSGIGKTKEMDGIIRFKIGGSVTYNSWYDGWIDDFRVWSKALSASEVSENMLSDNSSELPWYDSLIVSYEFDQLNAFLCPDSSGNMFNGSALGMPQLKSNAGIFRGHGFSQNNIRPMFRFEQGVFTEHSDSILYIDTIPNGQISVLIYADSAVLPMPTDTLLAYPQQINYTFSSSGDTLSITPIPVDTFLYKDTLYYYGEPFEVINKIELSRYITPYGNGLSLGTGWTWLADLTDYRHLLHDSVHLSAGNFQELLDMKFIMIEGTPPREVYDVSTIWQGDYALSTIDATILPKTIDLIDSTESVMLRIRTTGHGMSGPEACAEFCPKIHQVLAWGNEIYNWQILQNCGRNPLFPQGGTWVYDRAGWCPGMMATTHDVELTSFIHGDSLQIDYNPQTDDNGNYVIESQLFQYGPPNFSLDAAVMEILAPNAWEIMSRMNPICGQPRIIIRNSGSTTLNSLDITYGPLGGNSNVFQWTGNLAFMQKEEVYLPSFDWGLYTDNTFMVSVSNPNGSADEYYHNNIMYSKFAVVPEYTGTLVVMIKTNNFPAENHFEILDADGNIVYTRSSFQANALHYDTIPLNNGCYEFILYDDDNDGLSFWANSDGAGYVRFYRQGGSVIESFSGDFGSEIRHQFRISSGVGVDEQLLGQITAWPNPASDELIIEAPDGIISNVTYTLIDVSGRIFLSGVLDFVSSSRYAISVTELNQGIYYLILSNQDLRTQIKIAIIR